MKLSCEIIKDLLPLYCDSICSEESKTAVEEHLTDCAACSEELKKIKNNLPITLLQNEEGGFIIGGYKMNLLRKLLILFICVFALPLLNAYFSLLFGDEMFGYSFFITAMVLSANVFILKIKTKNRHAWLLASSILFPILMIAATLKLAGGSLFRTVLGLLLSLIPIYLYFIFSIVMYVTRRNKEPLPSSQYKKTAIVFLSCETGVLLYFSLLSAILNERKYRSGASFGEPILTVSVLAFVWLGYLFFKRFKRNPIFNTGVCIAALGIYFPLFIAINEMYRHNSLDVAAAFWNADLLNASNAANFFLLILIILCITGTAMILIGILIEKSSAKSEQPNQSEQPEQPEQSEQPEQPEQPNQPEQPEQSNQSEQPEQSNQSEQPEQSNQSEQSEQPEQSEHKEQ